MTHAFDKDYWERHWQEGRSAAMPPNPYLIRETGDLTPGTALDAGCGGGAEAIWLAARGWRVTAADISAEALTRAAERAAASGAAGSGAAGSGAAGSGAAGSLRWVEADLSVWRPDAPFDLVMTHYAHPAMPQLDFYDRIAAWVAPGGTLLIVGHLHAHGHGHHTSAHGQHTSAHGHHAAGHGHHAPDHGQHPPAEASVTAAAVTARLDAAEWEIVTAEEHSRTLTAPGGEVVGLHDVVVRATRRR